MLPIGMFGFVWRKQVYQTQVNLMMSDAAAAMKDSGNSEALAVSHPTHTQMEGYVKEDEATGQDMPADFEDGNTAEPRGPSDLPQGRVDGVLRGQEHQRGPEGEGKGEDEDDAGGGQPSGTMPTQRYGNAHGRYAAPRGAERGGSGSNAKTVQPDGCWMVWGCQFPHDLPVPGADPGTTTTSASQSTAKSWARQLPSTDKMHRQ